MWLLMPVGYSFSRVCVFSFVTNYVRAVGLEHILTKTSHSHEMYLKQSTSSGCAFPQRSKVIRHINPDDKLFLLFTFRDIPEMEGNTLCHHPREDTVGIRLL